MAITIKRILIDEAGTARVFYSRDDGPAGAELVELKGTTELKTLTQALQKALDKRVADLATPEGRAASRAARVARNEARRGVQ